VRLLRLLSLYVGVPLLRFMFMCPRGEGRSGGPDAVTEITEITVSGYCCD
jgi:hypothetical protein